MTKSSFRFLAVCALVLACIAPSWALAADFSASGLTVSGTAQQLGAPASYGGDSITVQMPGENPVISGVNPITGEAFSGEYRVTLANIDAHPNALPHWGVASADLMYEMPIQADGSTRTLALFMSEYPESAGPIRSARVAMCSLREMWGGTYCFYGYQGGRDSNNVLEWVKANSAEGTMSYPAYLNGMTKYSDWFPRSNDSNHVAPYNVRMNLTEVYNNYSLTPTPHPFLFSDTGLERGEDVNGIVISYKQTSPAYVTAYQYNDATGLYDRYRNGAPYVDALTGEQCSYANVLVIRTDISWASGNPSRPVIRLNGQGVCEIFQNGRYIRGTWARDCTATDNLQNRMVFFDENGQELTMKTGKTFIQIVDNEQPVFVLADGAIAGAVEPQEQRLTIGGGVVNTTVSTPRPTRTPKATSTPTPSPTPEVTPTPTPEATPEPTPTPDASQTDASGNAGEQTPPATEGGAEGGAEGGTTEGGTTEGGDQGAGAGTDGQTPPATGDGTGTGSEGQTPPATGEGSGAGTDGQIPPTTGDGQGTDTGAEGQNPPATDTGNQGGGDVVDGGAQGGGSAEGGTQGEQTPPATDSGSQDTGSQNTPAEDDGQASTSTDNGQGGGDAVDGGQPAADAGGDAAQSAPQSDPAQPADASQPAGQAEGEPEGQA